MQRTLGVALGRLERTGLQKPCWEMSGPWFLKPGPFSGQILPFGNALSFSGDITRGQQGYRGGMAKARHGWKSPLLPLSQRAAK